MICLEKPVLHASSSVLNYLRGDSLENLDNTSYRFAGYKNILFGCIIILGKVFAKSFHHARHGKYERSTRQITMSMYLLWRLKRMKSAV